MAWNIPFLSLLYFIQGIPYGFQSRFLPIYLRSQGQSLTSLGLYKLLLTPWLFKAVWSPFIDQYGRQFACLLASVCGLGVLSLTCIFIDPSQITTLAVVLFLMNIMAATQDICVDRMALDLLSGDELGLGNTAQVVGYKFGALFGGSIVLYVVETIGWRAVFFSIAAIYFTTLLFLISLPNAKYGSRTKADSPSHETTRSYFGILMSVIQSPGTKWMMVFLLVYKLGEQGALSLAPLYLVDHGVRTADIAVWTGMIGQGVSIAGSTVSGVALSRYRMSPHRLLTGLFLVQFVPLCVFYCVTVSVTDRRYMFGVAVSAMYVLLLISGLVTTAAFTAMMHCSLLAPPSVRATHYSVLAAAEIFGKLMFASACGGLTDLAGYANMYALFIGLSALVPIVLVNKPELNIR